MADPLVTEADIRADHRVMIAEQSVRSLVVDRGVDVLFEPDGRSALVTLAASRIRASVDLHRLHREGVESEAEPESRYLCLTHLAGYDPGDGSGMCSQARPGELGTCRMVPSDRFKGVESGEGS
jgi:hypothetical protein